ncbi:unnamed protein product [Caenorhabditis bovis]|uniref:SXP/RAL-2 family protein Ani s 5-like cation-binding domain-containing protein n=1 Tax=Caenorhabditis bovis TaxID=2654633 RepID=A0A8S1ELI8_9PELO|nr:unnamed protein product [Caenorhabditis bovis]
MRTTAQLLLLLLLFASTLAKPLLGRIVGDEEAKIQKIIHDKEKQLEVLREERVILEEVVENLSREIEETEDRVEQLKSISDSDVVQNFVQNYRDSHSFLPQSSQFRPG